MTTDDVVVEGAALSRLMRLGGRPFLLEMIGLFLEHGPRRLDAVRAAMARGDTDGIRRAAHSLRSTAGNLGARRVQAVAERLEERAVAHDVEALRPLVEEMARRLDQARERLEAEQQRGGSARQPRTRDGRERD